MLLSYYGITRYIEIYCKSIESYVKNFKKMKSNDLNSKIIISIYTDNFSKIKYVLKSLLDQTIKVDSIIINTNIEEDNIPSYIKNIVDINVVGKHYNNNVGNIIPTLLNDFKYFFKVGFIGQQIVPRQDLYVPHVACLLAKPFCVLATDN